jgi:PAS domain S-box-containing protein
VSEAGRLAALMELMRIGLLQPGGLDDALRLAVEVMARTVGVARAGVWTLTPAQDEIVCNDVYDARADRHEAGIVLRRAEHAAYFAALDSREVIAAEDALADPRTGSLAEGYLVPHGIGAMLDAPILADGAIYGVLCLEHVGGPRAWSEADRAFALAVANMIALVYVQQARSQSETRLRAILETVGEGIHGLDAEGRILFDNPAALAMLGYSAEEMRGRHSHTLIHHHRPDGSPYPVEQCPIIRSLRDGMPRRVDEDVFFRKDGTSFPVEYVCTPMLRADGSIAGAVVTFRDISARQKAERLLQAETEILDLISAGAALPEVLDRIARAIEQALARARVVISLIDETGTRFRHGASPSIAGYEALIDGVPIDPRIGTCGAAVVGRRQVITPDTETDPLWASLRETARAHGLRACWSTPALDADGKPIACFAVYHDHPRVPTVEDVRTVDRGARLVSIAVQRLRSLDALRASEATFREAFRDAATGIAVAGPDGLIQEVNEAFARILGYRPEELRGIDLQALTPPEDLPRARELREDLLSGRRQSYVREKRYRTRQGGIVWVRNSVSMRRDAAGRAISAIIVCEDITPQKLAERELRQNQALLQMASRIGQLGGWEVRLPGCETTWSDQVSAIYELPPGRVPPLEQALGFFAPEHRAAIRNAFLVCSVDGTPWDLELELETANGRRIWVRTIGEAVRDEQGRIVAVQGALQDISERKRAETRLRESEARFHAVASATADVIWDWDLRTDSVWWSDDFEETFGYPLDELEPDSRSWSNRIHPDDRQRVLDGIHAAIERRAPHWQAEYRFLHKDGSIREIEDHGRLILGQDGQPARFVGGMTDITARKRFERDLRERIKELRCLYRALELTTSDPRPIGEICAEIAALLPTGVLYDGIAVARIALEGAEYRSAAWQPPVQALRSPIRAGGKRIGQVEIGYPRPMPGEDGAGEPFLAEERTLVDTIATHVGRMVHDRRMAETLSQAERLRAVGELTGGIAHDFNNLLTVILGNAELLAARLADDPSTQSLALMAQTAAESAAELTGRLLAFARRQALDPKVTDVNRLLAGMKALLRRTLGEHIDTRLVLGEPLWRTLVDGPQLESAILNLCINARDAMPAGGTITIETANVELDEAYAEQVRDVEPGPYVMIAVSDTGTGMSPEVIARAFDPFFTTKEVGKGSGLGLSMVYGFVKQSQGHVRIHSELGVGTTVRIYLPRAAAKGAPDVPAPEPAEVPHGSERILLVEDDDLVRSHVSSQLAQFGYQVVSARNAPEALDRLETDGPFDLLFTDIVMPGGMSGRELAEEVRRRRPGLPVLFTSGYSGDAVQLQGSPGEGIGLITKPYRRQDLARRVREALAQRPSGTG